MKICELGVGSWCKLHFRFHSYIRCYLLVGYLQIKRNRSPFHSLSQRLARRPSICSCPSIPPPKFLRAQSNSPPWAQQERAAAPSGSFPVRNLHLRREPVASCVEAEADSAEGIRLAAAAAAAVVQAVYGVVGSRSARAGAARVAAAAERESLGAGRVSTAGRVAVVAEAAVVRKVLGLRFVALVVAAAVAARSSRMMFDRQVAAIWLGSDPVRFATARTAMMAENSAVRIGVEEAPVEARGIVVAVEGGTAGLGFVGKELLMLAGCTATSCSCLGTAQGTVIVRLAVEDSLGTHRGLAAVVAHSCRIAVRCQSSSFPFRLEGLWGQR
jgi:hypothetical protein